jgi:isopenicillin N synthase-like dioxygenase
MTSIPIIDIAAFRDGSDPDAVAAAVDEACRTIGFFVVTGHGVDLDLVARARAAARTFFAYGAPDKDRFASSSFCGYSPLMGERLAYSLGEETPPDLKEAFTFSQPDTTDDPYYQADAAAMLFPDNVYPECPDGFSTASVDLYRTMGRLSGTMMSVFATALGLPADYFDPLIDKHFSFLRWVHYPALRESPLPGQLRAGAHTDYGSFTFVNFDDAPGGLEVQDRSGTWTPGPMVAESFVVNLGDLFQVWTNDRWVSTLHRVAVPPDDCGPESDRLSLVYFHETNWDILITPLPGCVGTDRPPRYEPMTAGEHNYRKVMRQTTLGTNA